MEKPRQFDLKRVSSPTQKDIADALGVAQSTVATALNPRTEHRLLSKTAERIKAHAKEKGYRPQRFAQIMRGDRTRVIGVIVRLGSYSSNHELVYRLANELNRSGYRLVMVDPEWFDGNPAAVGNYLLDQAVEGVIFCNLAPENLIQELQECLPPTLPGVAVNSSAANMPNFQADMRPAFQHLTRYHLALGSRRIAFLSMFRDAGMLVRPDWTMQRINGFVQAIQEAGGLIIADESVQELLELRGGRAQVPAQYEGIVGEIISPLKTARVTNAYENGFHQSLRLIGRELSFDSLICTNDDTALGALAACADRAIRVPEEMRISGYDDTPAGQFGIAPLTTVRKPLEEIARRAVEAMLARIGNPTESAAPTRLLPTEILVRRSTGSAEENQRLADDGFFQSGSPYVQFDFSPTRDRSTWLACDDIEVSAA